MKIFFKFFSLLGKINFEGKRIAAKACSVEFLLSTILSLELLSREVMLQSTPLQQEEGLADFGSKEDLDLPISWRSALIKIYTATYITQAK